MTTRQDRLRIGRQAACPTIERIGRQAACPTIERAEQVLQNLVSTATPSLATDRRRSVRCDARTKAKTVPERSLSYVPTDRISQKPCSRPRTASFFRTRWMNDDAFRTLEGTPFLYAIPETNLLLLTRKCRKRCAIARARRAVWSRCHPSVSCLLDGDGGHWDSPNAFARTSH